MTDDEYPSLPLPDGRRAWVFPLTFGRARIGVGRSEDHALDDIW